MYPEIALHSSDSDDYFAYFDPQTPTTFVTALDNLEAFISQNGPYDAVLAYSHGAQLVASMLARLHTRSPLAQPFKCAVFLSGGIPYELVTLSSGVEKISFISPEERESLIHIPTANIWGGRDVLYPGHSKVLSKLCRADWNTEFVHTGGHEIPGAKTKNDLLGCVKAIQKTMDKALNSH